MFYIPQHFISFHFNDELTELMFYIKLNIKQLSLETYSLWTVDTTNKQ